MRDIKFRAWDKKKQMWTNWKCYDNMFYFMDKNTGVWIRDDEFERFILMQYTGLKDKKGKEIYEGDIVLISHEERDYSTESIFMIKSNKHLFGYEFIWERIDGYFCPTHILKGDYSNCEVIGNIYENPELLEV